MVQDIRMGLNIPHGHLLGLYVEPTGTALALGCAMLASIRLMADTRHWHSAHELHNS